VPEKRKRRESYNLLKKKKHKNIWQGCCHVPNKTNEKAMKENWPKL
jgi:hypothetical protein